MVIMKLKERMVMFFDLIIASTSKSPNLQKVAVEAKAFVLLNLAVLQPALEVLFEQGRYDAAIDLLVSVLKGNLNKLRIPFTGPLGWLWTLLLGSVPIDPLIDQLGVWLKANREMFKGSIGDGNPLAPE